MLVIDCPPACLPPNPDGLTLKQIKYIVWILVEQVVPMLAELRRAGRNPIVTEDSFSSHNGGIVKCYCQELGIPQLMQRICQP